MWPVNCDLEATDRTHAHTQTRCETAPAARCRVMPGVVSLTAVVGMSLIAGLAPVAHAAPTETKAEKKPPACSAVQLVTTAGTGESNPDDDPSDIRGLASGINFTKRLADRYDGVTAWQTPYNASAGVLGSMGESRAKYPLPYAVSKTEAAEVITKHLAEEKARCPGTKFVLTGYSQSAEAVGDVLEAISAGTAPVTPGDIAGAYLLGDPGRSPMPTEDQQSQTTTGAHGMLTQAGAVLIPMDQGVPGKTTHGLIGPRPAGAFANLPGKVRQFCAPDDKACAVLPDEPNARMGRHIAQQTKVDPGYYSAVPIKQMQNDGSFARAIAPFAGPLLGAITFGDLQGVKKQFYLASRMPGLTKGQRATLRLTGVELAGLMGSARIKIPERSATGSSEVDRISDVLDSIGDKQGGLGKLAEIKAFPTEHGAYTGNEGKTGTIDGKRVDYWIEADMAKLLEAHGAKRAAH